MNGKVSNRGELLPNNNNLKRKKKHVSILPVFAHLPQMAQRLKAEVQKHSSST